MRKISMTKIFTTLLCMFLVVLSSKTVYAADAIGTDVVAKAYANNFPLPTGKYGVSVLGYYSYGSKHSTYLYNYSPLKNQTEDLNCVIDIAASGGTTIYAVASGTVYTNANATDSGNYLVIKHDDGTYSYYGHMQQQSSYKKGSRVSAGTAIGKVGMTGAATGNHLHFEWSGHDPWCTYYPLGYLYAISGSGAAVHPHDHGDPFKVTKITVSNLTETTAKVHADVTARPSELSRVGVQWGKTTALSETALSWPAGTYLTLVEVAFDGSEGPKLSPGTTYYYRFYATTKSGSTIYDEIRSFQTPCDHSYNGGQVTKNPTCLNTGVKTFTCTKCGASRTETISATGHTEVTDAAVAATCMKTGKTAGSHCSTCGTVIKAQQTIGVKDHSYDNGKVTTQANCLSAGVKTYTCTMCGGTKTESIAATGHTEVADAAVEATCTTAGKTAGSHCSVCGTVIKAQETLAMKEHTEVVDAAVPATCMTAGKTEGSHCSVCGKVLKAQETLASGDHVYDDGQVLQQASCMNTGLKTCTCTVCGTTKTEVIAATGHTEVIDAAVPATCMTAGKTAGSHCSVCGKIIKAQETLVSGDHVYDDGQVLQQASCINTGLKTCTCVLCGATKTEVIAAAGHTEVVDAAVPATCMTAGKTAGSHCAVCGVVVKAQEILAIKDHAYDNGKVVKQATCVETGLKTCTCTMCGTTKTEVIAVTGHTEVVDAAVPATCMAAGRTAGSHCSVCLAVITAPTTIPALSHELVVDPAISATCTQEGKTSGIHCSRCNQVLMAQQTLPALGHDYDTVYTIDKKATVNESGSKSLHCKRCTAVSGAVTIPAASNITLSKVTFVYTGKAKKPEVSVKDAKGNTIAKDYYTISRPEKSSAIGKYTITIDFKGDYTGQKQLQYTILPKNISIASVTAGQNAFTVKWKAASSVSGYEIQYATNEKFQNPKKVTVKKANTKKTTVSKLKAKKKYYVRIRSYKTVGGTKIYGNWSKMKAVTTK